MVIRYNRIVSETVSKPASFRAATNLFISESHRVDLKE